MCPMCMALIILVEFKLGLRYPIDKLDQSSDTDLAKMLGLPDRSFDRCAFRAAEVFDCPF